MIRFPSSPGDAVAVYANGRATLRAGGTDVVDRTRNGLLSGDVIDLRDVNPDPALAGVTSSAGLGVSPSLSLGALTRIAALDVPTLDPWPGLREAARTLATPQVRAMATVGGGLLQANRCWYFRHHELRADCHKAGGATCAARSGDALRHALFDVGPCISVHPSTLGCALLAYDATYTVLDAAGLRDAGTIEDLFGTGADPTRDHQLPAGALLYAVHVDTGAGDRGAYGRATGRTWAEWPLVEATVRITPTGIVIAAGGVAPVPVRLRIAEQALRSGAQVSQAIERECASRTLLDQAAYKVGLLAGLVQDLVDRADRRSL